MVKFQLEFKQILNMITLCGNQFDQARYNKVKGVVLSCGYDPRIITHLNKMDFSVYAHEFGNLIFENEIQKIAIDMYGNTIGSHNNKLRDVAKIAHDFVADNRIEFNSFTIDARGSIYFEGAMSTQLISILNGMEFRHTLENDGSIMFIKGSLSILLK